MNSILFFLVAPTLTLIHFSELDTFFYFEDSSSLTEMRTLVF